jgi:predicted nucleic acid-binding protein
MVSLVVDASVGLKWFLPEPDSHLAVALHRIEAGLLIPDFWLSEATNVLWREVRRSRITPNEARQGLSLLRRQILPTPTADMHLHDVAMEIGIVVNHSPYDTMYLAFAAAMGAAAVVVADKRFVQDMQMHPDPFLAAMVLPLDAWARSKGIAR